MILIGFSITKVLLGVLCVSLGVLVLFIAYRKFLAHLGKGGPSPKDYCVLYPIEKNPSEGEVEIYFTTETPRNVQLELLNDDLSTKDIIVKGDYSEGGHIIRFDSNKYANGDYFYCLKTENQKTMKKIKIANLSKTI